MDQRKVDRSNFHKFFDKVEIHRITFDMAEGFSVILVVRNGRHSEIANELLERTLSKWENVLAEHTATKSEDCTRALEQPFDAFISYNRKDRDTVHKVVERLRQNGLTVWVDYEQIPPGQRWKHMLLGIIRKCRKTIICLGTEMGPTQAVEVRRSLEKEFEQEGSVIPVLLAGATGAWGLTRR
jgi:hypothetical protein